MWVCLCSSSLQPKNCVTVASKESFAAVGHLCIPDAVLSSIADAFLMRHPTTITQSLLSVLSVSLSLSLSLAAPLLLVLLVLLPLHFKSKSLTLLSLFRVSFRPKKAESSHSSCLRLRGCDLPPYRVRSV